MAKKKPVPKSAARSPRKDVGRPPPGKRKIVPDDYDRMARMYGTGCTYAQIAREYQVQPNTIAHHFNKNIFPMIQASSTRSLESELLKVIVLERMAWQCFYSEKPAEKRKMVKNQIEKLKEQPGVVQRRLQSLLEETTTIVHRTRDRGWLDIIKWCIEMRCRLEGHFAAVKLRVEVEEYRVAGVSPAVHMTEMMALIQKEVKNQREYEARLTASGVSFGRMTTPGTN